jgi:hypothetical protein
MPLPAPGAAPLSNSTIEIARHTRSATCARDCHPLPPQGQALGRDPAAQPGKAGTRGVTPEHSATGVGLKPGTTCPQKPRRRRNRTRPCEPSQQLNSFLTRIPPTAFPSPSRPSCGQKAPSSAQAPQVPQAALLLCVSVASDAARLLRRRASA